MSENRKDKKKKLKVYKKNIGNKNDNYKWILGIVFWTFIISSSISYISDLFLAKVEILVAFIILIIIILTGILFDIIGVSVTAADEVPFHSMASRKVKGARTSVALIRNADKVSNFCNDVIGDVCGIISGATGAIIIGKIITSTGVENKIVLSLVISGLIASMTVGGKAIGKNFAISQSNNIVYSVAWFIETIKGRK
jgi:CBS domain containing-hemolysin-like protein